MVDTVMITWAKGRSNNIFAIQKIIKKAEIVVITVGGARIDRSIFKATKIKTEKGRGQRTGKN